VIRGPGILSGAERDNLSTNKKKTEDAIWTGPPCSRLLVSTGISARRIHTHVGREGRHKSDRLFPYLNGLTGVCRAGKKLGRETTPDILADTLEKHAKR